MLRYDPALASERGLAFVLQSGYGGRVSGGMDDIFALNLNDDASPALAGRGKYPE